MNRNKILLYTSVAILWLLMVVFTLGTDESHAPYWGYSDMEPTGEVEIEPGLASVIYGPLATGDTQVVLHHGKGDVQTVIPTPSEVLLPPTVIPMGSKRVGVAFHAEKGLDTVVLFTETEALVFENVLALDTRLDRIACLQANAQMELDLVISSLDRLNEQRMNLPRYPASFLQNPQIDSAEFKDSRFQLRTILGTVTAELPSLI